MQQMVGFLSNTDPSKDLVKIFLSCGRITDEQLKDAGFPAFFDGRKVPKDKRPLHQQRMVWINHDRVIATELERTAAKKEKKEAAARLRLEKNKPKELKADELVALAQMGDASWKSWSFNDLRLAYQGLTLGWNTRARGPKGKQPPTAPLMVARISVLLPPLIERDEGILEAIDEELSDEDDEPDEEHES
jgi:hypothetical protein